MFSLEADPIDKYFDARSSTLSKNQLRSYKYFSNGIAVLNRGGAVSGSRVRRKFGVLDFPSSPFQTSLASCNFTPV